jgi:phage terminase large subunit
LTEIEIRARRQFEGLLTTQKRWSIAVAHRRAGKTVACVQKLTKAALECTRREPRFAYVAPLFNQAKDAAWLYLKHCARLLGAEINETELRADFPGGARIRLYGADNPDRLRGMYFDGVVMDEYADMRPSVWGEIIRPMLADRQGWASFIGTPKGRNEFWKLWEYAQTSPDWYALMLRASDTGLLAESELADAQRTMAPEQYAQEFECSFDAAILGAYYGRAIAEIERNGQIREVPVSPALPVHTAWDLGVGDSTAIWFFQVAGNEVHVVDFYENHGHGLPHYASVLASKGYAYGDDFVPHDARAREWGTGRTRIEQLLALSRKPRVVPQNSIEDGINAARLTLPHVYFDKARCAEGIEALRQYRADYDEKVRAFKNAPLHDWTSHAADAFRYLALGWREMRGAPPPPPKAKFIFEATPEGGVRSNLTIRELIERKSRRREDD